MNWNNEDWRSLKTGILGSLIAAAILAILKYSYPALKQYVIKVMAACSRASSKTYSAYSAFMKISWLDAIGRKFESLAGALVRGVLSIVSGLVWPVVILGGITLIARNPVNTPRASTAPTHQIESCVCPSSSNHYTGMPTYSSVDDGTPAYLGTSESYLLNQDLRVNSGPAPRRAKKGKKSQIIYSGLEALNAPIYVSRAPDCGRLPWGIKRSRPR
jgi:hypothetical protein